ncbi:hypothetical protein BDV28DRAFT_126941 [Aspergillus coremiiformis]|uniref:Uncharacterized protein n=1 Tax=Aspergillus coremiiformis TaxID=138285 RepID=A0A5N6ZHB8_9EURO|nr:hypothetical protein BDV28DRAFT_126941 [Aspergillus coremiiformis]
MTLLVLVLVVLPAMLVIMLPVLVLLVLPVMLVIMLPVLPVLRVMPVIILLVLPAPASRRGVFPNWLRKFLKKFEPPTTSAKGKSTAASI